MTDLSADQLPTHHLERSPASSTTSDFVGALTARRVAEVTPLNVAVDVDSGTVAASNANLGYDPSRHQQLITLLEQTPKR